MVLASTCPGIFFECCFFPAVVRSFWCAKCFNKALWKSISLPTIALSDRKGHRAPDWCIFNHRLIPVAPVKKMEKPWFSSQTTWFIGTKNHGFMMNNRAQLLSPKPI